MGCPGAMMAKYNDYLKNINKTLSIKRLSDIEIVI